MFTERVITTTLTTPRSVAVADINRDQIGDIVVASGSVAARVVRERRCQPTRFHRACCS